MEEKLFMDKSVKPDNKMLAAGLGSLYKLWTDIKDYIDEICPGTVEEWKVYGAKYGWTLKVLHKKRNLFFFGPYKKYFKITFVFGDKAVKAVEEGSLPENIITELKNAKKYMEGRGISIDVKNKKDAEIVKKLIKIKLNN